jgi:hypothetical protein
MVRDIHEWFAWFVIASNGVAGVWALVAHRNHRARSPMLWRWTTVAQLSIVVEVFLGVAGTRTAGPEVTSIHMFYGFIAMASTVLIYSYRQQLEEWRYLLYGFGGLFLMGLGIRALFLVPAAG